MQPTDATLAAESGDHPVASAMTPELAAELRPRLLRLAMKLLWNRDDAEEVVQDAYGVFLSKQPAGVARLDQWMCRVVVQLSLNRRRRRPMAPLADADLSSPAAGDDAAQQREQLMRLRSAIEHLPPQRRAAIVLRVMEQMNYDEIAAMLECSPAAARTHVHLAREELARKLADDATR